MNADTTTETCPDCGSGAIERWSQDGYDAIRFECGLTRKIVRATGQRFDGRTDDGMPCDTIAQLRAEVVALRSLATRLRDALRDAHEIADDPNNMMRWHDLLADADALLTEGHHHA